MNLLRSYENELASPIKELRHGFDVATIGNIKFGHFSYPFYRIIAKRDDGRLDKKDISLSGLAHGDEPAGGFAILRFLDRISHKYLDRFNFYCYPCINPSGFETDMRVNMDYVNLNRRFKDPADTQEVACVLRSLREGPARYHLTVDMHECSPYAIDPKEEYYLADNPRAFWMWETALADSGLRIGDKVVAHLASSGVDICRWPTIYDDINNQGVIWYPDGCINEAYAAGTSLEGYLYANYTNHSFTTETPTCWDMDYRVTIQIRALCKILDLSI